MIRDELKARGVELYDKDLERKSNDGRRGKIPTFDMIDRGLVKPGRNMMDGVVGGVGGGGVSPDLQAVLVQLAATNPAWAGSLVPMLVGGAAGAAAGKSSGAKQVGLNMTTEQLSPEVKKAVTCASSALAVVPTPRRSSSLS